MRAGRELDSLYQLSDGKAGVAQRWAKQSMKAAPSVANPVGLGGADGSAPAGAAFFFNENDKAVIVENIRNLGNQALYRRGNIVVTPDTANLDVAKDAASITTVDRYSTDYFALVSGNTVEDMIGLMPRFSSATRIATGSVAELEEVENPTMIASATPR